MPDASTPESLIADLSQLLRVKPIASDTFEGARATGLTISGPGRVFGGQVIAQAAAAAELTVAEDRPLHSLHAYFLRMGDSAQPIRFEVMRDLDGGSFSNRRVVASQAGRPILTLSASFQTMEDGLQHQDAMPADVPPPEAVKPDNLVRRENSGHFPREYHDVLFADRAIEIRTVEVPRWLDPTPAEAVTHCWIRAIAPVADDPRLHRAMLAYASDMALMPTALIPHGHNSMRGGLVEASLDHGMWFHEDFRMDDWLLYQTRSGWSGHGRGFITGNIWTRAGKLVASVAQEGMMRIPRSR